MNGTHIGTKPFQDSILFRNVESATAIEPGRPVVLVINATEDGFAGVLPVTATAAKTPAFGCGVYSGSNSLAVQNVGKAQIWGICNYAIVAQQTRSATTASFSTASPLSVGQPLTINTAASINAFGVAGAAGAATVPYVTGTAASDTLALTLGNIFLPYAVLAQTLASAAASASTSSDTRLAVTFGLKVFLRMM